MLFFDIEATGTDPSSDRIVELAVLRVDGPEAPGQEGGSGGAGGAGGRTGSGGTQGAGGRETAGEAPGAGGGEADAGPSGAGGSESSKGQLGLWQDPGPRAGGPSGGPESDSGSDAAPGSGSDAIPGAREGSGPERERGDVYLQRFDPGRPIPPEATAVHGITDEDVEGEPRFEDRAGEIQRMFRDEVLCGYNIRRYDTLILDAELRRAGQPGLDLGQVREVDLYRVWREVEPRSLASAVRRYLGRDHDGAHTAEADAGVLPPLMRAMARVHGLDMGDLLRLSRKPDEVDRARRLRVQDGEVVFNFGLHEGEPIRDHEDYLDWMLSRDFPEETKERIRRLRDRGYRLEEGRPE